MKYIITETKLSNVMIEFMREFIEGFVESKVQYKSGVFFIIEDPNLGEDYTIQYMEHDYTDGRLWINKDFLEIFDDTFPFAKSLSKDFIKNWFENKYKLNVSHVVVTS